MVRRHTISQLSVFRSRDVPGSHIPRSIVLALLKWRLSLFQIMPSIPPFSLFGKHVQRLLSPPNELSSPLFFCTIHTSRAQKIQSESTVAIAPMPPKSHRNPANTVVPATTGPSHQPRTYISPQIARAPNLRPLTNPPPLLLQTNAEWLCLVFERWVLNIRIQQGSRNGIM